MYDLYNKLFVFILFVLLLSGCLNNNLVNEVKNDFSQEQKVTVFNKSSNKSSYIIPLNGMIVVKKNETIYSIANKFQVIPKDIINDNNLIKPFKLKLNQILFLRHKNIYVIKKGDTLASVSIQYAVNQSDIIKLNNLKKPFNLMVDSKIFIPPQKNYSVIDKILEKNIYKKNKKYTKVINFDSKLIKYAPKFMWPLKGDVVKNFGKFGRGLHYDGIDINSKKNIPILSSFNGKVAFVGSQIKKYGNLILIKHDNGWLTAYSNVGKFTVKQGETVLQGQIIANSSMNKEIFHFQIRYKRNPVDPLKYLN